SPVWKSSHSCGRMPSSVTQTLDFSKTKKHEETWRGANDQDPPRIVRRSRLRSRLRHLRTDARSQARARSGARAGTQTRAAARAAACAAEARAGKTQARRREDHLRRGRALRL